MFLEYTPVQQQLRTELRSYFHQLMTREARAELAADTEGGVVYRELIRQMGKDGWLGIGWPVEYGGQGRPAADQFLFFDEARRAGAPVPFVTLNTVGPTLIKFGSTEQKMQFLPGILDGSVHFAIGYTEPEAGTDLAALRTRAVRDGTDYVIDGQKIFTSGGEHADFIWLAVRTNTEVSKHRGISILLVPTDAPGFHATPIRTVGGVNTSITHYENVRVPVQNLVGDEDNGWAMITTQLNHERVGLAALAGLAYRLWDEVRDWAASTPARTGEPDGPRLLDVPWVQTDLARCWAVLDALKLLNWRLVAATGAGTLQPADSSAAKVFGTESLVDVYRRLVAILGPAGYLAAGSPGSVLRGDVEKAARAAQINTFGGGVNEVQRQLIATTGLGLARARARQ